MDVLLFLESLIPVLLLGLALFFTTAMIVHAITNNIPNKLIWIIALLMGSFIISVVYYFAVCKKQKNLSKGAKSNNTNTVLKIVVVTIFVLLAVVFVSFSPQKSLREIPLSEVISQANNGQISKINIKGDELEITKKGENIPSYQSRKEPNTSLYDQGLNKNSTVEISISPK